MTTTVVPAHRLQMGVEAWIASILPAASVLWNPVELPRESTRSLVVQPRVISGLTSATLGGIERRNTTLPMQVTATIAGVSPGDSVLLCFSGLSFEHTATAGQTGEDVRDALLVAVTSSLLHDVTAIGVGSDKIQLSAPSVGDMYGVSASSNTEGVISLSVDATQSAQVTIGEAETTVQIQAYSTNRYLRLGAAQSLATLLARQNSQSAQSLLESYAISILGPVGQIIDLTALSGPQFESRAAVNVQFTMPTIYAEAIDNIETTTVVEEYII